MTSENELTEGERQLLLSKYKNLQSDSEYLGQAFWVSAGIFTSITTAALGWSVTSRIFDYCITEGEKVFTLIISFIMILILACLVVWLRRINLLIQSNDKAAKEIEKRILKYKRLNFYKLSPDYYEKKEISSRRWWQRCPILFISYLPVKGKWIGNTFFYILIIAWVSVFVYSIILLLSSC